MLHPKGFGKKTRKYVSLIILLFFSPKACF